MWEEIKRVKLYDVSEKIQPQEVMMCHRIISLEKPPQPLVTENSPPRKDYKIGEVGFNKSLTYHWFIKFVMSKITNVLLTCCRRFIYRFIMSCPT